MGGTPMITNKFKHESSLRIVANIAAEQPQRPLWRASLGDLRGAQKPFHVSVETAVITPFQVIVAQ